MELTEPDCMIKRVISADNVMETGLVRPLYWGESSNSWSSAAHLCRRGKQTTKTQTMSITYVS